MTTEVQVERKPDGSVTIDDGHERVIIHADEISEVIRQMRPACQSCYRDPMMSGCAGGLPPAHWPAHLKEPLLA